MSLAPHPVRPESTTGAAPSLARPRFTSRSRSTRPSGLATALTSRDNAINSLRLVLAVLVIAGHADHLGGFGADHAAGLLGEGAAVDGFFILSGYLMARSWSSRPDPWQYLWRRTVRLMPAFWFSLVVTAFILAPLAWYLGSGSLSGFFTRQDGPLGYLVGNATLWMTQPGISGGPTDVPVAGIWNGAAWTLAWLLVCDLALLLLGVAGIVGRRVAPVVVVWLLVWAVNVIVVLVPATLGSIDYMSVAPLLRFSLVFFTGVLLFTIREHVPLRWWWALASAALVLGTVLVLDGHYRLVASLPLAYLLLWIASRWSARFGARNDLSYGLFLFGFPVAQVLAGIDVQRLGWILYVALTIAIALLLAWPAWMLVEKRAMALPVPAVLGALGRIDATPRIRALETCALFLLLAGYLLISKASLPFL